MMARDLAHTMIEEWFAVEIFETACYIWSRPAPPRIVVYADGRIST